MLTINSNLLALNAKNNFNIMNAKKIKSSEKLSSGYRINRSADDAAGLAISEKMRRQIRGLDQGTTNATDGISWCQTGDGALDEAHDILHRMSELTIKSLNETISDADRLYLEMEFDTLQSELDKIGRTTQFNEINIFEGHITPYYQCEGGVKWDPHQMHVVSAGSNDLTFEYRTDENAAPQKLTVTVPPGEYTTQELVDEIETALNKTGQADNIMFELADTGFCNANLEGGEVLDAVSGGLSYLLYNMYQGGGFGALIGTTIFPDEYSKLEVVRGQNDHMSFLIEDFDGNTQKKEITIPEGKYNKGQLIDLLNKQLAGTSVKASSYGTGIKLGSDSGMVTGFKGNMFKIDGGGKIYNSVFYDNVKYGDVTKSAAEFKGGFVLPTESRDEEHKYYQIDSSNNSLVLAPNGLPSITLTIPDGKYTTADMVGKLNELFLANKLGLTAKVISNGSFRGIQIDSNIKGLDSAVGLDPSCSAFDTLFVTKEYNQYGSKQNPTNETKPDKNGVFTGGRSLVIPFKVTAGKDDSFTISIDGDEYTITMPDKPYNTIEDIRAELDNQLNGPSAKAGYKGKLDVTLSGTQIRLTGAAGKGVDKVAVKANGTNEGYDHFFAGTQDVYKSQTVTGTGSVTLNTPFDGTVKPSDKDMNINFNGTNYPVTLPTGDNVTQQDIINAIQTAIPPRTEIKPNKFSTVNDTGKTVDNDRVNTATGNDRVSNWSGSNRGSSQAAEGVIGFEKNEPAVLTLQPSLKDSMTLDSTNNQMQITINKTLLTVTIPEGTYTKNSLKDELQKQIDNTFGTGMGGATVDLDPTGNKLVLEARLPAGEDGADTFISCSTGSSSFLKELNTTRDPAVWRSNTELSSQITIDGSSQTLVFQYTEKGVSKNLTLNLTPGTYSRASMVTEINRQLAKTQTGITASLSGTRLVLTSDAKGKDVSISYSMGTGGTSAEKLFGPKIQETPADILVNLKTEESIKIEAGKSDQFSLIVNGKAETVTLQPGTYDRNSLVTMLNGKLKDIGVEAYVSGNKLGYRTTSKGNGANISMSYDNGGTAMKSIYGETKTEYPGITASFDASGKLVLTSTKPGISISVPSSTGGAFQQSIIEKKPLIPTSSDGYHSTKKSYINGVPLQEPLTIDEWNNNLKFTFQDTGSGKTIEIEVPQKENYTFAELQSKLQDLIDAKAGADKIKATVDGNGVRLEAVNPGSLNTFSSFSGGFYDKVFCSCAEKISSEATANKDGNQIVNQAYTIGRKDVKNQVTEIRRNINDNLTMDFTFDGIEHKLEMKLDPGKYTGEELKEQVQEKINEQLKAAGLEENLIEVGLGDINSGVAGANDDNALNFKLSMNNVKAPVEGQYVIEGVRGNAAFEIFYQTDGKMIPAFIKGTKDISEGVTIGPAETQMSLEVDGKQYNITLPEGTHTQEELLNLMNNALNAAGAPLTAEIDGNVMKLSHTKMGEHIINILPGEAKKEVFFTEKGNKDESGRIIQMSGKSDDDITLKQHVFNTNYLRINSVCISKYKYAQKAAGRLQAALKMISDIRSDFGSTQNRLEYAINSNRNTSENTQGAESLLRDTDMAKEMVQQSNHNILGQSGSAMLAQANSQKERLLQLLQ